MIFAAMSSGVATPFGEVTVVVVVVPSGLVVVVVALAAAGFAVVAAGGAFGESTIPVEDGVVEGVGRLLIGTDCTVGISEAVGEWFALLPFTLFAGCCICTAVLTGEAFGSGTGVELALVLLLGL